MSIINLPTIEKLYPRVVEPLECTCTGVTHWHGKVVTGPGTDEFTGAHDTKIEAIKASIALLEEIEARKK